MTEKDVPLILRRKIEAELMERVRNVLAARLGKDAALDILAEAVDRAAFQAGQAFASSAPEGPSLSHFAGVLNLWRGSGALEIADVRLEGTSLTFAVTRCDYASTYAAMGLSPDMAATLSCRRDAAFAAGYSPRLRMSRPDTIARGAARCGFVFTWEN